MSLINSKPFNLLTCIADTQHVGKVSRLILISRACPNLRLKALESALDECISFNITSAYEQIYQIAEHFQIIDDLPPMNTTWLKETKAMNEQVFQDANQMFSSFRTPAKVELTKKLIKYADRLFKSGCTSHSQLIYDQIKDVTLDIDSSVHCTIGVFLSTVLEDQRFFDCLKFHKISSDKLSNQLICCSAIDNMLKGEYRRAAELFTHQLNIKSCQNLFGLFNSFHIVLYALLCILIGFSRKEINDLCRLNSEFQMSLSLCDLARSIFEKYVNFNYSQLMSLYRRDLMELLSVDLILQNRLQSIDKRFKLKLFSDYLKIYQNVSLEKVSKCLSLEKDEIENLLIQMADNSSLYHSLDDDKGIISSVERPKIYQDNLNRLFENLQMFIL